ncbi:MAG: hypothetical protein J6J36_07250 [Clostridia bacterium]|nr:hypothetical protein [Clostridia bacterium]
MKKKIKLAVTSKKIAALISSVALALPITACTNKNVNESEVESSTPVIETTVERDYEQEVRKQLCDTSYISLEKYLQEYLSNYEKGYFSLGTDMYKFFESKYNLLTADSNVDGVTCNFDESHITAELHFGEYRHGDITIKRVRDSSVWLKTLNGSISIEKDGKSYIIVNEDTENETESTIKCRYDGSFELSNSNGDHYVFGEDGKLKWSEQLDYRYRTEYEDGKITYYTKYDEESQPIEKRHKDGSYEVISYDYPNNKEFELPEGLGFPDAVYTYKYGKDDKLKSVNISGRYSKDYSDLEDGSYYLYGSRIRIPYEVESSFPEIYESSGLIRVYTKKVTESFEAVVYPDKSYYKYYERINEDGSIAEQSKEYCKNDDYKIIEQKFHDENGNEHVCYVKWNYKLLSPSKDSEKEAKGDLEYASIDNVIITKMIDEKIYKYYGKDESILVDGYGRGDFKEAYSVQKDGIIYYREDGSKQSFFAQNGDKTYYDENESITKTIINGTETEYYDYDSEFIKSVYNKSDKDIVVSVNGEDVTLSKNGKINYTEEGNRASYYNNGTNIDYFKNGGYCVTEGGVSTSYDEYNCITNVKKDGISISYYDYDTNSIKAVRIVSNEDMEIEWDGFQLKNHSSIEYNEDGSYKEYKYDDNYSVVYGDNNKEKYVCQGDVEYVYTDGDEHKIRAVHEGKQENSTAYDKYTTYYDYDNQIVKSIKNNSDDGACFTVSDVYGNEYNLYKGDEICYYENQNVKSVKQGNTWEHHSESDSNDYYIIDNDNGIIRIYSNNEFFGEYSKDDIWIVYDTNKGKYYIERMDDRNKIYIWDEEESNNIEDTNLEDR